MKKLLSIMLISLMLIALLTACGAPNNTDTDSQIDETNTDKTEITETNSSISSGTNDGVQENNSQKVTFSDVTFVNKEHSYYTFLNNIEFSSSVFPDKQGTYIKLVDEDEIYYEGFETYDELFQYNDILAVNIHKAFTPSNYKLIGCYGLEIIDSKYSLSLDYYGQIEDDNVLLAMYECLAVDYNFVMFFAIPKGKIDTFEGVKEVTINENLIMHGSDYSFAKHYKTPSSSQDTMVVPVTLENKEELINKYSLDKNISAKDILVYLPFEMQGDMFLKEAFVNGKTIEIVFENYTHVKNAYIEQNDARYYLISSFDDFEKIPDDYEINITVNIVYVPCASLRTVYIKKDACTY